MFILSFFYFQFMCEFILILWKWHLLLLHSVDSMIRDLGAVEQDLAILLKVLLPALGSWPTWCIGQMETIMQAGSPALCFPIYFLCF
jgi:hypothetical protein